MWEKYNGTPNVTKVQLDVVRVLPNVTIEWTNVGKKKEKRTTKCDKSTITCNVNIAKCDNRTIKCEKKL